MKSIVLFASGSGSNAENLIRYFSENGLARVTAVFCNNPQAGVLERAKMLRVPTVIFTKPELETQGMLRKLEAFNPSLIVLCGFLLKMPSNIVTAFPDRIINIHPALLPKYGGKGMYGMHVHQAVRDNKEAETGISIHYVNEHYDQGTMIAQHKVTVDADESPEAIAKKVQRLEHEFFPAVIAEVLKSKNANPNSR